MASILFVYGTLRPALRTKMAMRLVQETRLLGPARIKGQLLHIADYPGLRLGGPDWAVGDLVEMIDPTATFAWVDAYEECSDDCPRPHEYRRELVSVDGAGKTIAAWTYVYALPSADRPVIVGGDFLSCVRGPGV